MYGRSASLGGRFRNDKDKAVSIPELRGEDTMLRKCRNCGHTWHRKSKVTGNWHCPSCGQAN